MKHFTFFFIALICASINLNAQIPGLLWEKEGNFLSPKFSSDNSFIIAAQGSKLMKIDPLNGDIIDSVQTNHKGEILKFLLLPDNKTVITIGFFNSHSDSTIYFIDIDSKSILDSIKSLAWNIALSPDGKYLFFEEDYLKIYSIQEKQILLNTYLNTGLIDCFTNDYKFVSVVLDAYDEIWDVMIHSFDAEQNKITKLFEYRPSASSFYPTALAGSKDGKYCAFSGSAGKYFLGVIDVEQKKMLFEKTLYGSSYSSINFYKNIPMLIGSSGFSPIDFWTLSNQTKYILPETYKLGWNLDINNNDSKIICYGADTLGEKAKFALIDISNITNVNEDDTSSAIQIYPVNNILNIETNLNLAIAKILNIEGATVYQRELSSESGMFQINVADFASGTYFLNLSYGSNSFNYKFIKE